MASMRRVRIWDSHTGALLRTIPVGGPGATLVEFGPDSSTILTVDAANNIRTWDTCPGCGNPAALLGLARTRVIRQLTPDEKQLYHVN